MKNQSMKEFIQKKAMKAGSFLLAAALVMGGSMWTYESRQTVPELVTYTDTDDSVEIAEDETPLAKVKVTKKTTTKKKTKKIKMKKASKKTYTKKGKTKTKKSTKTKTTSAATTKIETVTATTVTNKYKKGSKINTQVTQIKTTVTTTVTPKTTTSTGGANKNTKADTPTGTDIRSLAPMVDSRVMNAFERLGFKIVINPGVPYSGLCDARTRTITLKKADGTIYHELGHFVAFVAGNMDMTPDFQGIYGREKSLYTAFNKAYVLANSSEYFAESFRNYTENKGALSSARPETYNAMEIALSRMTDEQIDKIIAMYGVVWGM